VLLITGKKISLNTLKKILCNGGLKKQEIQRIKHICFTRNSRKGDIKHED
jgi:hypothetical protein